MYLFEAHYENESTLKSRVEKIEFNVQDLEDEKECYMLAMSIAYDMKGKSECLTELHFIGC